MSAVQTLAHRDSLPIFIIPATAVIFAVFGVGPNYQLALLCCAVLIAGVFLLWRPGEPQILLFLFVYQWLQLAIGIFYANLRGVAILELSPRFPEIGYATALAALALLFLAVGIRLGAQGQKNSYVSAIRHALDQIPASRWLKVHLAVLLISTGSLILAQMVPGLSQPLLALANFKWSTFLIFTIATFARPGGPRRAWLVLFCVEFLLSLGGYFSSFKSIFLYTLIAITAVSPRITLKQVAAGVLVGSLMLILGLYWTAVKEEYRAYISGGKSNQTVVVGYGEALQKAVELVQQVDSAQLMKAADDLEKRFAEIDMFSAVLVYVPQVVDHEWGKLWADAVLRPFMPRIFFPDKAVIDESEMTNRYTGLRVAGLDRGTQISMGYIADSYIDFGEIGMMGVILLFGYFIGYSYRWLINHPSGRGLIGCGLASATLLQVTSIGISSAKLVGGIVVCLLVAFIVLNFVLPHYRARLYSTNR